MYIYVDMQKHDTTMEIYNCVSGLFQYKFVEGILITVNGLIFYTLLLGNNYDFRGHFCNMQSESTFERG